MQVHRTLHLTYLSIESLPVSSILHDGTQWHHVANSNIYGRPAYADNIFLSCGSLYLLLLSFSLPILSHRRLGCLPYFHTWCGPSANLGCRSETCCSRLAGNAGCKKSPSGHHHTTLSGHTFATKACIVNRKKLVKQQYLLHMFSQYGELRPTNG